MMDCETKVIFTKDPHYIINAHSWPEDPSRKPNVPQNGQHNPNQSQISNQGQGPNKTQPIQNGGAIQRPPGQAQPPQNPQPQAPQPNLISANLPAQPEVQETVEEQSSNKQKLNKKERKDFLIKEMRKRIDQYFEINVRQVGDMVPKIITNFLINDILV
jgi:hypothetical protein